MKKVRNIIIYIIILFIVAGGVFSGTKFYDSRHEKTHEVIKEVPVKKIVKEEVQISGETIRSNMANMGKLCTAEYNYTHVETINESKKMKEFKIPFTTSTCIYSYDGVIMAGINFENIRIDKNDEAKIINVSLPNAEIISSDVDQDSFKLYDEKKSIFNPISVTDVTDSFANLKNNEEEKAKEKGLLNKAENNAIILIQNFIQNSYNVENYDIKVQFDKTK